jgi:excisionase family DNA binding protein
VSDRVETPKQLAERVGINVRSIYNLIHNGELESVPIGGRVYLPADAWPQFLERKDAALCRKIELLEVEVHGCPFSGDSAR